MATIGGGQAEKNKLEKLAKLTKDGAGRSGADLAQAALLNLGATTVGAGKDGARLEQMVATDSTIEVEVTD